MFSIRKPFPGVTHLTDAMGVSMTLIEGRDRALLLDTGYGLEDVRTQILKLTDRPVTVILSHGHHDHILGARWFEQSFLREEDRAEFSLRTALPQRQAVLEQARAKGLQPPEDFLTAEIPEPAPLRLSGRLGPFGREMAELGDLEVQIIHVPGHTPGSVVCFLPACQLLLTGDDWNPCTWVWFPSSLPVKEWRSNMETLLRLLEEETGKPVAQVLCSHEPDLRDGEELKGFLRAMTDERLAAAKAVNLHPSIRTYEVRMEKEGWTLVFDRDKLD